MKACLKLHGFETKFKKCFWHSAALLKLIILIGRTIYAFQTIGQPKKLAELVATYPVRFMAVYKMFVLYFDQKRVKYFYRSVTKDFWDFHVAGPLIQEKVLKRFHYVNVIILCHLNASLMCLGLLIFFPLVDMPEGVRPLPNIIWTPFDTNPSPLHEILYIALTWNLSLSIFGNGFYDILYVYSLQHLYVQFILLKELLTNITDEIMKHSTDSEKFHSDYFQKTVLKRLKICVRHHSILLRFGKNLEIFSSKVLLLQLLMTYSVLVINGFILSMDHSDIMKTVMLFNLTGSCMIQIAVFAIQASDLKEQSLSIIDAINEMDWFLFQAPIKRSLTFVMLNSKKGISIKAGGMIEVDNEVLVTVTRKALSAITLLRALINEEGAK